MILFPAIDLKDGQCVRLLRGDMDQATVFSDDPAGQAAAFIAAGADWLHIVDLNGAFAGAPVNGAAVEAILGAAAANGAQVQLGGGIRDLAMIETWLDAGVARVILGTAAVKDPDMVMQACRQFPDQIDALQVGGLHLVEQFCKDHDEPFTHAGWRGRMRTCNGVGSGPLTPQQVGAFDRDLGALLGSEYPTEPLLIPHRIWATVLRKC